MNTFAALQTNPVTTESTDAPWQASTLTGQIAALPAAGANPSAQPTDELARIFNTALVSTRDQSSRDWLAEIQRLMDTPAFRSLMSATRHLARAQGISDAAAAEEMIRTVRSLDSAWRDYVFQEGLDRIKSSG